MPTHNFDVTEVVSAIAGRQFVTAAVVAINTDTMPTAGVNTDAILPGNAIITGGSLIVSVANDASVITVDLEDNDGSAAVSLVAGDAGTVDKTDIAVPSVPVSGLGAKVMITTDADLTLPAGKAYLIIEYIVTDRSNFSQA